MRAIFISYRRDDSEGHAGRLFEDLCERFGKDSVFMDVAGIEPGRDFRRVIEQQVASCGVLLAIIGKNWLGATDAAGRRRLDDASDFVRLETANALKRDIPVIPVLVHDAAMPDAAHLPEDLKDLAFRNSVELTHARWGSDVQLLIKALMPYVDPPAPVPSPAPGPSTRPTSRWIAPVAVLALGGLGYAAWDRFAAPRNADVPAGTASMPDRMTVAPGPLPAAAPPTAMPTASAPAQAILAAPTSSPTASPTRSPATAAVGAGGSPRPAIDRPAAPPAAASRHVARPAAVPADVAPKPAPAVVISPSPSPSPSPASAPAPAPAVVLAATPAAPAPGPAPAEAVAAPRDSSLDLLGSPATAAMATRTIVIGPDTGYVNVTGGEIIRFDVGAKSFVWNFNGQRSSFDLARVAPPAVLARKVTAYVAPNPMYPRRN